MRNTNSHLLRSAAVLVSVGFIAAGCSSGSDSDEAASGGSDLDGVSVTVGSKNFTENILLGEMLAQAMESQGADVTNNTNLGATSVNRNALESGDIDVYPDYNGTGWTVHLKQQDPSSDPEELFENTATMDLAENNIAWVGRTPFNNTYGFAANGELAEAQGGGFDIQGMADYLKATPDALVCMEPEFPDRPDGLILFEEATGYEIPESQINILESGIVYTQTGNGTCDFGEIFTTDGRIPALNLSVVDAPGVFILYNASYTWDADQFNENAETYEALVDEIMAPLDNEKMLALNSQVDNDGEQYEDVAAAYLEEIGLK